MGSLYRTGVVCGGISLLFASCSSGDAHIRQGDVMLSEAKLHKAISEYELALKTRARDQAIFRLAGAYENAGELAKAEKFLSEATRRLPSDPTLRLSKARILAATGRKRQAFEEARRVAQAGTLNPEALAMSAIFATTTEEIQLATDKLATWLQHQEHRAGSERPGAEALIPLAWLNERLGDPEGARRVHAQAKATGVKDLTLAITVANTFFSTEQLLPAEELYTLAAKHSPKRAATWIRLAAVRVALKEWVAAEDALRHLDHGVRNDPDTQLIEARIQLGIGQSARAQTIIEQWLAVPNEASNRHSIAEAHYWLGHARLAQHDAAGAETAWKEALDLDATFDTPKLALADLYVDQARPGLAVEYLRKLAESRPDYAEVFRLLGRASLANNDGAGARRAYERYQELAPENPEGPYLVATALIALGRLEDAHKQLETALALDPTSLVALRSLVTVMTRQGKVEEAENRMQIELAQRGRSAELLTLLGDVLYERREATGMLASAELAYQEAANADASYTLAWLQLGNLYAATGRSGQALLAYQAGAEHAKDPTELWLLIGQLHARNGDGLEAKQAYEQVLARQPNHVLALNNLAYVYLSLLKDSGRALSLAERARTLAPESASVADTYGWILWQQGRPDQALPLLQDAAMRLPKSAEAQYHLGLALMRLGQKEQGRAALARALDLSQTFLGANEAKLALRPK